MGASVLRVKAAARWRWWYCWGASRVRTVLLPAYQGVYAGVILLHFGLLLKVGFVDGDGRASAGRTTTEYRRAGKRYRTIEGLLLGLFSSALHAIDFGTFENPQHCYFAARSSSNAAS